jgi:hypothetical protein
MTRSLAALQESAGNARLVISVISRWASGALRRLPCQRRPGRESRGSCVEDGREEDAILIIAEVIDERVVIGWQWFRGIEHVAPVPLQDLTVAAGLVYVLL